MEAAQANEPAPPIYQSRRPGFYEDRAMNTPTKVGSEQGKVNPAVIGPEMPVASRASSRQPPPSVCSPA